MSIEQAFDFACRCLSYKIVAPHKMIKLDLPSAALYEPRCTSAASTGNVYLDKSVQAFRKEVWAICAASRARRSPSRCGSRSRSTARAIAATTSTTARRALLDALEHARFIDNDRQVTDLHLVRGDHARRSVAASWR
jgi:hypothetical protein